MDLIILRMVEYDVIFGMDFLSKYIATVDCKAKKVNFLPPGEEQFEFESRRPEGMISSWQ